MLKYTNMMWVLLAATVITSLIFAGHSEAAAVKLADGTYEVQYTVKKPDDESASIANDYFEKPARVEVNNGEAVVYFQTNHNKWIKSLKYPAGNEGVELEAVDANEAEDTKVIRLPHKNVLEPAAILVHVIIDELGYDQAYTVRLVFETDQLPLLEEPALVVEGESPSSATEASMGAGDREQSEAVEKDTRDEPAIEPTQQEQVQQELLAADTQQLGQETSGLGDGESAPERSEEDGTPVASGNDAEASEETEMAEGDQQVAAQESTGNSEHEPSGRIAWVVILSIVLAGCVLAAIVIAFRRQRSKRQVN
jgi:hypothetical protein